MTSFRLAAFAALAVSTLAAAPASAEDRAAEALRELAQELRLANDSGQVPGENGTGYAFGQNLPVLDLAPTRSPVSGFSNKLTPQLGTSASFPAVTLQPIDHDAPSFGFRIRF